MRKTRLTLAIALIMSISFGAFAGGGYPIDTEKSELKWLSKKVTGQHDGAIKIKNGTLDFKGGQLKGGEFVIDMSTIKVLDISEDSPMNKKLVGHLNSPDFFDVEKFTEASLKITSVDGSGNSYKVNADLTIKGKTNPVTFDANVNKKGKKVSATAEIVFDRSKYDIRYGSNSFYDNLGDKAIYDDVQITVSLVTK